MNSTMRLLILGLCIIHPRLHSFGEKTLFGTRSQAVNSVRELAGWQRHINRPDYDSNYFTFSVIPEYDHSFKPDDIACFLLGGRQLTFKGSLVDGRDPACDILADYFGLPSDFQSTVFFDPTIVNFVLDLNWYVGLDGITPGLFMRIHVPIVHTKWDLDLCECIADAGTTFTSYPAGYFSDQTIPLSALVDGESAPKNVRNAFQGRAKFGDMQEPLKFGKIFGRQNETRVAELWGAIGYNFLLSDWYHFGLNIRAAAPTGTLRKSEFLFEPIAGNDHHWELGGGVSFHVDFYTNEEEQKKWGLYVDANLTHMFDSTQKRSFDLCVTGTVSDCCVSAGSRYMLLQEINGPAVGLHVGTAPNNTAAANQYQGRLVPAINTTTIDATISVDIQADVVAKLYYQRRGFEFDIGYNLWARSKEKLQSRDCIPECFALKGDAQVYGFTNPAESAVALNATQSNATIRSGQGITNLSDGNELTNINADNASPASDTLGTALLNVRAADAATFSITQQAIQASNPAVLITNNDIDECSALLPKAISHKLFGYIGYTYEREGATPSIGVGSYAEWADTDFDSNSAYSQWGVWLKTGVNY